MYCRKCGKKINDDALFCPYCGTERLLEDNNNLNAEKVSSVDDIVDLYFEKMRVTTNTHDVNEIEETVKDASDEENTDLDSFISSFSYFQESEKEKEKAYYYAKAIRLLSADEGSLNERINRKIDAYNLLNQLDNYADSVMKKEEVKSDIEELEREISQANQQIFLTLFKIFFPFVILLIIYGITNLNS